MRIPESRKFWVGLALVGILLQLGDGLSTYILAMDTFLGAEIESNIIAKIVLTEIGVLPGLIFLKTSAAAGILFCSVCIIKKFTERKILKVGIIMIIPVYLALNVYNWYLVWYVFTA